MRGLISDVRNKVKACTLPPVSGELRVGMAGFGLAGQVFHAPLIAATDGLRLARILTTDPERRAKARSAYADAALASSLDELCEGIDVLVVATTNDAHVPLAGEGLDRGLAVVVDKPLAVSAAAAAELVARGGRLTVYQNRRWDGDFMTVRAAAEAGELGELTRFDSRFDRFVPVVRGERWREWDDPAVGGGLLLDIGSHLVDQALLLGGPVRRVYAELDVRRPGARVEDDVYLSLEHRDGLRSQLWTSTAAPLNRLRLRLSGLAAGIATYGLDPQWAQLTDGMRPGDPGYGAAPPARIADAHGCRDLELRPGSYQDFYAGVVAWLREQAPAPVDPADSLAGLRVLDAAREAAASASVVELDPA
jgi:scyllo-inositol 2-dehydrogenase (NADP+)